jgi:hypothetical protein
MTQATFDPSDTGGWHLSNGDRTATTPANNTQSSIYVGYGVTPIPDNAKTYFEFKVSGAAIQTAFNVGFGVHGFDPSNKDITDEGAHISNATFVGFSYNLSITNSGDVIYDPQGDATYRQTHPGALAAPNQWPNGSVIGVMVDRINNTVQFTLNGRSEGGPFDISGLGSQTLYPFVDSWDKSGPVATINGGTNGFAEGLPSGYTALSSSGTVTAPPVVASPSAVVSPSVVVSHSVVVSPPSGTVTIGSGSNTLALKVSEDAWQGNAQFTVSVDGHQIGGPQTATASHAAGQSQTFDVKGTFAAGDHTATIKFLNDAYAGPTEDRNLYVTGATIDNSVIPAATLTELKPGPQSFRFLAPGSSGPGSSGSADTVTVNKPASLQSGLQTITGNESDPSQPIFLDWHTYGAPALTDSDWLPARVSSSGAFSASVTIDHAGTTSALFYRVGSGPPIAAWSGDPS